MITKTITLELDETVLLNRKCSRCGRRDSFHAIHYKPMTYRASCSLDCSTTFCGHLLRIDYAGKETRCGDMIESTSICEETDNTAVPMAACLNCGKIVNLQ
jgi:ribosomal protein S27AE